MSIRSQQELDAMMRVGRVVGLTLREMKESVRVGMTTAELDRIGAGVLRRHGARSAPQVLYGFPAATCISLNDEAVHGIPGPRPLRPGDLVKLDVTAELDGYIADAAVTVPLDSATERDQKLCSAAETAFHNALGAARAGRAVNEIGRYVEMEVRRQGFRVIRELRGHGVGRAIHEEPTVPNYCDRWQRDRLTEGLIITIEPIIAAGKGKATMGEDGWTVRTADGSRSAHFEHTIMVTRDQPILLTAV
jgi:methionyl aminopeptidase